MKHLDEIVEQYLNMDTNYAMMITGAWGVGKTHYFKKDLSNRIASTDVFGDSRKKYRPVLVSLFGLQSIDEIQAEIFFGLYPWLKDRKVKLASAVGKTIFKGILFSVGLEKYAELVEETKIEKQNLLEFRELVLCFDDLERRSSNIGMKDFIGFINQLVENANIKVILIAHEPKIEDPDFVSLKEKTIGCTIEYIQDSSAALTSIIDEKFGGFPLYRNYLLNQANFIHNEFFAKSKNLRHLSFSLSYFQSVFSLIEQNLIERPTLERKIESILLDLLKFTLAISDEYRNGRITSQKRNDLNVEPPFNWEKFKLHSDKASEQNVEKTYRQEFIERHYQLTYFNYYDSIVSFVTGGSPIIYEDLLREIEVYYDNSSETIEKHRLTFERLKWPNFEQLSNEEYLAETKSLLKFAMDGKYDLSIFLSVYYMCLNHKNPLNFSKAALQGKLLRGMKKSQKNHNYIPGLEDYFKHSFNKEKDDFEKLVVDLAISLNNKNWVKESKERSEEYENLLYSNFEEFLSKFTNQNNNELIFNPVFKNFNVSRFYSFLINSTPYVRLEIRRLLETRYQRTTDHIVGELLFLEKLLKKISTKDKKLDGRNMDGFFYQKFKKVLDAAVNTLKSTKKRLSEYSHLHIKE